MDQHRQSNLSIRRFKEVARFLASAEVSEARAAVAVFSYNVHERGCGVYTLGYDAIPELKSRRNQLNQEGSP